MATPSTTTPVIPRRFRVSRGFGQAPRFVWACGRVTALLFAWHLEATS